MATKTWAPNENQAKVLNTLKENAGGLTLAEISEKVGFEVKSGTTNTLVTKGLMEVVGEREVIVQTKRKVNVYALVDNTNADTLADKE